MKPGPLYTININMRRLQRIHVRYLSCVLRYFFAYKGFVAKAIFFRPKYRFCVKEKVFGLG